MADAVIFSDIMAHLIGRLTTKLSTTAYATAKVSVQADDSPLQVILRRDGGNRVSKTITSSVIGVNIYAANYGDAEGLARLIEAIFDDLPDGNPITYVGVQSSAQDVSDLKSQRRFLRFAVDNRGTNLN